MKILKKSKRKILPMKIKCVNCRSVLLAEEDDIYWDKLPDFSHYWYHIICPVCGKATWLNTKQEEQMEEFASNKEIEKRFKKGE